MQVLFSRLAQARHCGCRACHQAAHGLGRHVTTATKRRKPTFADIFTACYSSMFASAAIVDAIRKEDRKQDLDRQIDETKRELSELQESQLGKHWERSQNRRREWLETNRLMGRSELDDVNCVFEDLLSPLKDNLTIHQMDMVYKAMREIFYSRPFMKEVKNPLYPSSDPLIQGLQRRQFLSPGDNAVAAMGRMDYDALEKALHLEESNKAIRQQPIHNDIGIQKASRRTMGLVKALLYQAGAHKPGEGRGKTTVEDVKELIEVKGFPHFKVPVQGEDPTKQMALLHKSIRNVISNEKLDMSERVARVCYNLLISPFPPNMHTLNTLMTSFDRVGQHHLSEDVAFSFQYRQRLSPTPLTYVILLNHYKEAGNPGHFFHVMRVMAGADPHKGAKIDRQRAADIDGSRNLFDRIYKKDTRERTKQGAWYVDHVPLHVPLIQTMLDGLLHFRLFDQAAMLFSTCLQAGIPLTTRAVNFVLEAVLQSLDYKASVRLASSLIQNSALLRNFFRKADHDTRRYLADRILALMELCGILAPDRSLSHSRLAIFRLSGEKIQQFIELLQDLSRGQLGTGPRYSLSTPSSTLLQMESLRLGIAMVRRTAISLERKLLRLELPELTLPLATILSSGAITRSQELVKEYLALANDLKLTPVDLSRPIKDSKNPLWDFSTSVFTSDSMKLHTMRAAKQKLELKESLPLDTNGDLSWLKEWEKNNQGKVTRRHKVEVGWYWETRSQPWVKKAKSMRWRCEIMDDPPRSQMLEAGPQAVPLKKESRTVIASEEARENGRRKVHAQPLPEVADHETGTGELAASEEPKGGNGRYNDHEELWSDPERETRSAISAVSVNSRPRTRIPGRTTRPRFERRRHPTESPTRRDWIPDAFRETLASARRV